MNPAKWKVAILAVAIGTLCVTWTDFGALAKAKKPGQDSPTDASAITQEKIVRAMSAGPTEIASAARIVDTDAQGNTIVLREGSNGFTCVPGNPEVVGKSATCVDAASMQWMADFKAHKPKPTTRCRASPTCLPAPRREAIPTLMTKRATQSASGRTG